MAIEMGSRAIRALSPRFLQHWGRDMGAAARGKILILSGLKTIASKDAAQRLERKIGDLQIDRRSIRQAVSLADALSLRVAELLESVGLFKSLFEDAPIGFHVLDTDGNILQMNKKELEMFGYTEPEIKDKTIFDLIVPEQRANARERFYAKVSGTRIPEKLEPRQYLRKDGTAFYGETVDTVVRHLDGRIEVQTALQDISSSIMAERLRKTLVEYERLAAIGELAADISHTYKNQILALVAIIERLKSAESEASMRSLLPEAETAIFEMEKVVRGILSLAKIGTDEKVELKVRDGLDNMCKLFKPHAERAHVNFTACFEGIGPDIRISISESGFQDLVRNLVFNAIDAVSGRSAAEVKLEAYVNSSGVLTIIVEDNGPGIEPEKLIEIRAALLNGTRIVTTKGDRGSGIGLSVVGKVAAASDGKIEVSSILGRGTKLLVSFPIVKENDRAKAPSAVLREITREEAASITVLTVDDDSDAGWLYKFKLDAKGYTVIHCSSAEEAEKFYENGNIQPDLVIVDKNLPGGISGLGIVVNIKGLAKKEPLFIMCSGDSLPLDPTDDFRIELERLGIPYVQKSADLKDLLVGVSALSLKIIESRKIP